MSILTIPIEQGGPIVRAAIGVSVPRVQALQRAKMRVPSIVFIKALLDTGASGTAVDAAVIRALGITPRGIVSIHTPSTGGTAHVCNQFDVSLLIMMDEDQPHMSSGIVPVVESDFSQQGIQALIGRDVLNHGVLIYDGRRRFVTLAF